MNLFTTYTKEEIKFLQDIVNKNSKCLKSMPMFSGLKKDDFSHFHEKRVSKKEIVEQFDFIYVKKGKIGVIKNGKIVKVLKESDCFGFLNVFSNEKFVLIGAEESEVILFGIKDFKVMESILYCVAKEIKGKVLI